ncbi:MAG: DUF4468 domain-containing protein [Bacteroidia bacterium]|nr:DUF4468 domain-containing protein [Bacteroidia bacterium]
MRIIFSLVVTFFSVSAVGQVTIYADAYPKGVVCQDFSQDEKVFYPIDNPSLKLVIHKNEVSHVIKGTDTIYKNKDFKQSDKIVVPIELTTGKILITEVLETKSKQADLYNSLKAIPSSKTKYEFISANDADKSVINYAGFFYVKFAGDLNTIQFTLTIKLKEGKVKYEFTNFRMYFAEQKGNSIKGGRNYTMDATHVHDNPLERFYLKAYRGDKVWEDIWMQLDNTVNDLKAFINKPIKSDW